MNTLALPATGVWMRWLHRTQAALPQVPLDEARADAARMAHAGFHITSDRARRHGETAARGINQDAFVAAAHA